MPRRVRNAPDGERSREPGPASAGTGGTLYVVATPIGNLADVTLRALETLRAVPLIAAEDTRVTRRLLDRHGIDTRMVSFHARSGSGRVAELLAHLRSGEDLALVTDAGTPAVSDPGEEVVVAWAAEGGSVVAVPGPSAVLAAVVSSGIAGPRWGFEGFLPRSGRERRERLERIAADDRATVVYEAPTRLMRTLADLASACGRERRAAVCRELTKLHEQVVRATLDELREAVADGSIPARGEVVVVVSGRAPGPADGGPDGVGPAAALEAARTEVEALVRAGTPRGAAVRAIAARTGISRRALYTVDGPR